MGLQHGPGSFVDSSDQLRRDSVFSFFPLSYRVIRVRRVIRVIRVIEWANASLGHQFHPLFISIWPLLFSKAKIPMIL